MLRKWNRKFRVNISSCAWALVEFGSLVVDCLIEGPDSSGTLLAISLENSQS